MVIIANFLHLFLFILLGFSLPWCLHAHDRRHLQKKPFSYRTCNLFFQKVIDRRHGFMVYYMRKSVFYKG